MRSSASFEVLYPVLVRLTTGSPSSSNSTLPSCADELMLNACPASASISACRLPSIAANATSARSSCFGSTAIPVSSIRTSVSESSRYSASSVGLTFGVSAREMAADASARSPATRAAMT